MQKEVIGNATLYCGDALEILPQLEAGFNGLITDPPYSSGGTFASGRQSAPDSKYGIVGHLNFSGDNRDARSWAHWSMVWLSAAAQRVDSGGYVMLFTDWRQLPATTDVIQGGGVVWRGIVPWDKTLSSRAPHKGYFRHQCEYVVWGSIGPLPKCQHGGPWPGLISQRVIPAEKLHMTAKPVPLMDALIKPLGDIPRVLDPFMGSASTAIPVLRQGGFFTGIEMNPQVFDIACERIYKEVSEGL
ncbi:DNA methyltransferase [Lelliottia sp. SL45]|uniref:DNA-methyltransferase n=1 Tax=Lelliottia sp. SL45 TaxID=2994665 RepID=UPI002276ED9E|nr:DNA methyltransferase [Lelliottia sp. SL45]MCY1697143.1 DNA methyltransferase [Lelliottia sp. SL45]